MATITQPLRDEHKELFPEVETLRQAAETVREDLSPSGRKLIEHAYEFLRHHLLPHAQAEEAALYPVVQKVMGASHATATMSRDHVEVERLTEELGLLLAKVEGSTLTAGQVEAFRRVLYGLYTLVKVHFAKEEEVYLPLLDARLKPAEAQAMFANMEKAAQEAKEKLHV